MILERLFHLSSAVLMVALMRGLAVLAAGYAVTALAKNLSSETRHMIWLGVIGSFILIPLTWLLLPPLRIGAWIPVEPASAFRLAAAPVLSRSEYVRLVDRAREQALLAQQSPLLHLHSVPLALVSAWLAGVLALAARLFLARRRLRSLVAAARGSSRLQALAGELAGELSIRRRPAVLLSPRCSIPFIFGLQRPLILLPEVAATWPAGRLRSALLHELIHAKRRDVLAQSLAYAICLLFWFIPPLWMAYAALLREAETCCDQQVINRGVRVPKYARDIVDLAWSCEGRILLPTISTALGRRSLLKERIKSILHLKPGRPAVGARGVAWVPVVYLACLVPLLAVTGSTMPSAVKLEEPLVGAWVNPEYEGPNSQTSRFVIYPDGKQLEYLKIRDIEPAWGSMLTVEEKWIDRQGNHWYKVHGTGDRYGAIISIVNECGREGYSLVRINAAGTVLEGVSAQAGYPEEFSQIGGSYGIYYRQD
jgi:beta-lactamase regulating signal transducer with metallopeptidase domain